MIGERGAAFNSAEWPAHRTADCPSRTTSLHSMDVRRPPGRGAGMCRRRAAVRVPVRAACRVRRQAVSASRQHVAHAIGAECQRALDHRVNEIQRKREIARVQNSNHGAMGCDERLDSPYLRHGDDHLEVSRIRFRIGTKRGPMTTTSHRIFTDPDGADPHRGETRDVARHRQMRDTVRHTIP